MIQFKKLTTNLPAGTNTYTFTDALINDASVIEVYTDNDDVYPVNLEQHGQSIEIQLSDHAESVNVALTINNVVTYEPTDISGLEDEIQSVSDNLSGLASVVNEISDNIDTIEGDVSKVNQDLTQYKQNGFLSDNLLENIAKSQTISGITFVRNEDGSIVASGTATTLVQFKIGSLHFEKGKIYKLIGGKTDKANDHIGIVSNSYSHTTSGSSLTSVSDAKEFTDDVDLDVIYYIYSGKTLNNYIIKPMVTMFANSTYDDYTPYAPSNIELKKMIDEGGSGSQEIYDDTERIIGTWFGKPLYEKTIHLNLSDGLSRYAYIDNTISVKHAEGYIVTSAYKYIGFGFFAGEVTSYVSVPYTSRDGDQIKVLIGGYTVTDAICTYRYTKAGD